MLTHEDADAGILLAAATRRDSSSMKTIAIMTMVFLPGTFLAALFAMPPLRLDTSLVVAHNFWIYWACFAPLTGLVFLVWLAISEWKLFSKKMTA